MALARALVTGAPDAGDDSFWAALGIPPEMRAGIVESAATTEIWPESAEPFGLFSQMLTQWRTGMSGPTGLDYAALPAIFDMNDIAPARRRQAFDDLRVMESEALAVMRQQQKARHG